MASRLQRQTRRTRHTVFMGGVAYCENVRTVVRRWSCGLLKRGMNRTRINQNTINSNGAITGTNSHGDPRMPAGMTRCCPRKNEPDAMVRAADMRQRCLRDPRRARQAAAQDHLEIPGGGNRPSSTKT